MAFQTSLNGTLAERMRIDSVGKLIITAGDAYPQIVMKDSGGTVDGYVYASSEQIGFLSSTVTWLLKLDANSRISLSNNDDGTSNTIFGKTAGDTNGAGDQNVYIGELAGGAGIQTDASDNNVGVGYSALTKITTGHENVVVGSSAG